MSPWPILLACLPPSLPSPWRSRLLCFLSLPYHTVGCRNSAFVMAMISLLCSQVELRWNSTGSHCVPIFRILKKICSVLKGWNEARGALAAFALWGNTQRKHNENNLVLQFLCTPLNLSLSCPFSLFYRAVLSHSRLPSSFGWVLRKTQRLTRWQPPRCQTERPSGCITLSLSAGYANKV